MNAGTATPRTAYCERILNSPEAISGETLAEIQSALNVASQPRWSHRYGRGHLRAIRLNVKRFVAKLRLLRLCAANARPLLREIHRLRQVSTEAYMVGWHDGRLNGLEEHSARFNYVADIAIKAIHHTCASSMVLTDLPLETADRIRKELTN
ncbi:hypothetical protein EON81_07935 [bacterium]|nr:MAG: hypothetical protein EON81_07935 [bacterium]